jgi:hypothetical protein
MLFEVLASACVSSPLYPRPDLSHDDLLLILRGG